VTPRQWMTEMFLTSRQSGREKLVGRVFPRHGHRGRPLNSGVRQHQNPVDAFDTFYYAWSVAISGTVGICVVISVISRAKREPGFLRKPYWTLVAISTLLSIAVHFMRPIMMTRRDIWGQELIAYAMLAGALVGGVLAVVLHAFRVRSNNSLERP